MAVTDEEVPTGAGFANLGELLDEVRSKREAEQGTAAPASEPDTQDTPAVPAGDNSEPPAEEPKPRRKVSWQELQEMDLGDDVPHGFYKGKPATELFKGLSESEGAMHEANRKAKLSEAEAAAATVISNMLQEKLKQLPAQQAPAPTPERDVYERNGIDVDLDIVTQPKRVLDALETDILSKAERQIMQKLDAKLAAADQKRAEKEAYENTVKDMRTKAESAAIAAMAELNIPREHQREVLDLIVPIINNPAGEFYNKGGLLVQEHYTQAVEKHPMLKQAIRALAPAVDPPKAPPLPGSKAAVVAPSKDKPSTVRISNEARELALSLARSSGVTDAAELERVVAETAERIQRSRAKGKNR